MLSFELLWRGALLTLPPHAHISHSARDLLLVKVLQKRDRVLARRAEYVAHRAYVDLTLLVYRLQDALAHVVVGRTRVIEGIIQLHKPTRLYERGRYLRLD